MFYFSTLYRYSFIFPYFINIKSYLLFFYRWLKIRAISGAINTV